MKNENLDEYIQFLMGNIDKDDRINLNKKMKYGFRHYYLTLTIDEENQNQNQNKGSIHTYSFRESLEIFFDNRNKCIEVNSFTEDSIIVENEDLLNKWNPILEEYINREVDSKIKKCFEESLMKCANKSLHREYQMKKIL
jgi:hypothetical protein